MATITDKLLASLQQMLAHDPWYGPATYDILEGITFEMAYEKPPGSVHNIAGILLHMLGWTQEVTARMGGKAAGDPEGGDWPDPGIPDEDKWKQLVANFKLANVTLGIVVRVFPEEKWNTPTNDTRNGGQVTGATYHGMIEGLIQHHIYHSGQVALLKRILGG
jgi:uncharacterized damage-inducible protein DinB